MIKEFIENRKFTIYFFSFIVSGGIIFLTSLFLREFYSSVIFKQFITLYVFQPIFSGILLFGLDKLILSKLEKKFQIFENLFFFICFFLFILFTCYIVIIFFFLNFYYLSVITIISFCSLRLIIYKLISENLLFKLSLINFFKSFIVVLIILIIYKFNLNEFLILHSFLISNILIILFHIKKIKMINYLRVMKIIEYIKKNKIYLTCITLQNYIIEDYFKFYLAILTFILDTHLYSKIAVLVLFMDIPLQFSTLFRNKISQEVLRNKDINNSIFLKKTNSDSMKINFIICLLSFVFFYFYNTLFNYRLVTLDYFILLVFFIFFIFISKYFTLSLYFIIKTNFEKQLKITVYLLISNLILYLLLYNYNNIIYLISIIFIHYFLYVLLFNYFFKLSK